MRIAFVPIDNRPVCYTLPKLIAEIDNSVELLLPARKDLGDLTKIANLENIFNWLQNLNNLDGIILSLDTLAYGGLIPSRRCPETFSQIKDRISRLKEILLEKKCKILAFSSIMRISNNNYNEEEKLYWAEYGKKIFAYSYNFHKNGTKNNSEIPQEILEDYLNTRNRNFEINKIYLNWQKEGLLDTLVFSKDDCAEFGLNVMEAKELEALGGYTKTGADEIPLSLLSRITGGKMKVCPIFLETEHKNLISNYEDVSIENSVKGQLELANCTITPENEADIILYVNNFKNHQGEIVMKVPTEEFDRTFTIPNRPYMIADVRFANGADNNFIKELFKNKITDKNFFGYSAWNTSANSLGSLILCAKMKFYAKKYNKNAFEKVQITRFLDDWAYQANVRQKLQTPDKKLMQQEMKSFEKILEDVIITPINVKYEFPWKRLFEVEIEFS